MQSLQKKRVEIVSKFKKNVLEICTKNSQKAGLFILINWQQKVLLTDCELPEDLGERLRACPRLRGLHCQGTAPRLSGAEALPALAELGLQVPVAERVSCESRNSGERIT